MTDVLGIIYAYHAQPGLGALVSKRTAASLPFCSRYRAIDFALSGMANGGIRDVGVVMQRDYQSLLDHLGNGRDWDLNRRGGGLRLLPPFGLPDTDGGEYSGSVAALNVVRSYIEDSAAEYIFLQRGNLIANLDTADMIRCHIESGADITAVRGANDAALEIYILSRALLLDLLKGSRERGLVSFHRDLMPEFISSGGRVNSYLHSAYALPLETVADYYRGNMDMLRGEIRQQIFPGNRPVYTKERADVSTYYGPAARVRNCLVADGCYIEGTVENCVVFRGVRIGKGAVIRDSVIMQDSVIERDASLRRVIADKNVFVSSGLALSGAEQPMVIAKGCRV